MRSIYKYNLVPQTKQEVVLQGKPLSVGVQNGDLMLWAHYDDNMKPLTRTIWVYGTGHVVDAPKWSRFLGTVFIDSLVFHVFTDD